MKDHFKKFSQGYNQWLDVVENMEKLKSQPSLPEEVLNGKLSDIFPLQYYENFDEYFKGKGVSGETLDRELMVLMSDLLDSYADSLRKTFKFQMHQPDIGKSSYIKLFDGPAAEVKERLGLNAEIPMSIPFDKVFLDLALPDDDQNMFHTLFFFRNNWGTEINKIPYFKLVEKIPTTKIEIAFLCKDTESGKLDFRFLPFCAFIPKEQEATYDSMEIEFLPTVNQLRPIFDELLKSQEGNPNRGMFQNLQVKIYSFFKMLYLKGEGQATQSKHGFKKPAQVEARSPKKQKKHPDYEYHLLEIKPNVTLKSESENGTTGVKQRRHMVRGFYRNYKRPIRSGPNVGKTRVFIPSHARGDEALGVIRKDYVFASEGQ